MTFEEITSDVLPEEVFEKHLSCRLIPVKGNQKNLSARLHRRSEDLALVYERRKGGQQFHRAVTPERKEPARKEPAR